MQRSIAMNFDFDSQTRRKLGYQLMDTVDNLFGSLPDSISQRQLFGMMNPTPTYRCPQIAEN